MTDQPAQDRQTDIRRKADELEKALKCMERPDRAIPLADEEGDDDGVGPMTGIVP